ncbi:hypothetical protein VTN02DRAFT_6245 [Thermoascus thermophilus]
MRYHTSIITLFTCRRRSDPEQQKSASPASEGSQQQKSPETKISPTPAAAGISSTDITLASARSIAELVRIHRREYGMSRSHAFALYAINLALFTLLDHAPDPLDDLFDDPDFLALAAAFAILASRSILGRNTYHLFRQAVRSKVRVKLAGTAAAGTAKAKGPAPASRLPDEIKDLLLLRRSADDDDDNATADEEEPSPVSASSVSTAGTAFSLIKGPSGGRSPASDDDGDGEGGGGDTAGLNVCEMLERYEALSLGRDERA